MAGLMKPQNAAPFIESSGAALASCLEMARAGCEIVDLANSALGDLTSQPSLNAFLAATANTPRPSTIPYKAVEPLASYLSGVRSSTSTSRSANSHPLPVCMTMRFLEDNTPTFSSNPNSSASSTSGTRLWTTTETATRLGNVIKVTPSSKAVGDMALFLLNKGQAFRMSSTEEDWRPTPGHVHRLREVVGITEIRGETAKKPPLDFESSRSIEAEFGEKLNEEEIVSSIMYPAIYPIYRKFIDKFGDMAMFVPTRLFHFGLEPGQTITMKIPFNRIDADLKESLGLTSETGPYETLEIQLIRISAPDFYNTVTLTVRVNKQVYQTKVTLKAADAIANLVKADPANKCQIGSSIPELSATLASHQELKFNLDKISPRSPQ
ncbi:putative Pyruvate carboxylase [Blattamonas nauphoetae]|uniref:Pyruvate carboxylase n=1 Tax=Blattamonas nauphoetae TaxID=2049346 RepID=A0ABQ9WKZ7_9EUKA|nr:putative Pyruvate carboxylase [Blattamonas nauphoetae]